MTVADHFSEVKTRIRAACREGGRSPDGIDLMAVSKQQADEKIDAALALGHRCFGENRVQEAKQRWESRRALYRDLRLHMIGSLQTNKVREAVALFDCIESVDRPALVKELSREMTRQGRPLPCLVQVNTGDEPQKGGVALADLTALLSVCRAEGLKVEGLMCIPPPEEPAGLHFSLLRKLALAHGLKTLSMGMSHDLREAVIAGATRVRIGSALFGERKNPIS